MEFEGAEGAANEKWCEKTEMEKEKMLGSSLINSASNTMKIKMSKKEFDTIHLEYYNRE